MSSGGDLFWVSTKSICSLLIHVLLSIYFVQEFDLSWRKNANWIIWNSRYHFQAILVRDVLKVQFLSLFVSSMEDSFILNLCYLKFKDFMFWVQKFKKLGKFSFFMICKLQVKGIFQNLYSLFKWCFMFHSWERSFNWTIWNSSYNIHQRSLTLVMHYLRSFNFFSWVIQDWRN